MGDMRGFNREYLQLLITPPIDHRRLCLAYKSDVHTEIDPFSVEYRFIRVRNSVGLFRLHLLLEPSLRRIL